MTGPGVYDSECTLVRESAQAEVVIVIIRHGDRGDGFSVQATSALALRAIPQVLRALADEIERDMKRAAN